MKCPKCQTENPDARKFCKECGTKLVLLCPQCYFENFPGDKFCGDCGYDLSLSSRSIPRELSFDEKIAKIQKYLPGGLTEKILSQRDRIEGERKQVTVMFCDMEGYTGLTEKLGPEEAYSMMDKVYEILIHKVHDYEGTVNELTGDGIMALFGAPIALEDAPQRAIRSALAIHREISKFSDQLKSESKIPPIKMRIGIHTGPVVVGTLGNDLRVEFKAVGDTVNLASRMEGLADPGTTYVTEDTFKLTEGFFRFEALGEKKVKGKEEPVKVYQVIAPSTRRTKFDVSAERGLTSFVGRERELELLLDGFERSKERRGQAFSIMAEAGLGKSRLLYEFRKAVASQDVTFLEGRCLSYGRSLAYHPVIEILKSNFDIGGEDGDQEIKKKMKKGLGILKVDEASTLPYLLELLSVKESGIDKIPMSLDSKRDRIIEALKRIVLKGSEIRPLIMAIEDLHWIDKRSEECLKYLLESISGARILFIYTYRPEFVHTWGAKSYHNQLTLHRLSNRESLEMVTSILGTREIERTLEELILQKTEGVPFFIEEFIKSLKDLKIIERKEDAYRLTKDAQQLTIPSTIQDVIMARVDSLPDRAKEVLQTGSVIEREFSYPLIKRIMNLPEQELLSQLSVLKDSELLYERGIFPQSNYIFKHALTREVVYDSILNKRKKELHEKIGNAIEELHKESVDEHYGALINHYMASENFEKSAQYSKLAGKKAGMTGSINEAIDYAKKTIFSLERLPRTDEVQKMIVDVRTILGIRLIDMNYLIEAKEIVEPIKDIVLKSGYQRRLAQILIIHGGYEFCVEENFSMALDYLNKALLIAEEMGDMGTSSAASYWLAYANSLNCEFEKALYYLEKAMGGRKELFHIAMMKSLLSYLGYYLRGKVKIANQISYEALQIAEESGDIYSKSFACGCHGISCYGMGFLEEAKTLLLKGIDHTNKIDHHYWSADDNQFLAEICFEMGKYQIAKDHYKKAIRSIKFIGWLPSWINLNKIAIARAKVMNYETDVDLESLFTFIPKNKVKLYEGQIQRHIGEILLNIIDQHSSEAEHWIQKAIEADKRNRTMFHLGKDYALYAELFKRKGHRSKAQENLGRAIEIFKECGADGWVEKYEKELVTL